MTNILPTDITKFSEDSYLNYSMYVILDRALPKIEDGLKPVQRRLVYAMSELGLQSTAKYKKSARTIGDVLGKYHPHGDSACYEAMVNMAQDFSYRNTLVDGQGNWGSQDDPKSFAAMRYTEARLTAYAGTLLNEIKQGTTDFVPNFDGTMKEPAFLPAQVPNILLNHVTGIAVGMGTEIPSHNLNEVVSATKMLLDKPSTTTEELLDVIPGPDLATGGLITNSKSDLIKIYNTGLGSIRMRAKHHFEGKNEIVFTELPFKIQGTKVIEKLAALMQAKKLSMVEDIRDESDHENPIRIVVVVKKNAKVDLERVAEHLFSVTDLEQNMRVDMKMIGLDGNPRTKSLKETLTEWISFRQETVRRKLNFRLGKINDRLHLIEGLLIAFLNIDEVIEIIRTEDNPKEKLISRFNLTDVQANYILDTKLRNLAKLEEMQLKKEQEELEVEADLIELTLSSERRLNTVIKKGMDKVVKDHGTPRKTVMIESSQAKGMSEDELVASEPVTIVLSEKGWIRAGKGHELNGKALQYKTGDSFMFDCRSASNKEMVLLDNTGRSYTISNMGLPTARSFGDPVTKYVSPPASASLVDMFQSGTSDIRVIASTEGYGFLINSEEFYTKQKKGKAVLNCASGSALRTALLEDNTMIAVATRKGHLLCFASEELPELKKGKGNKLIGLSDGDSVISVLPFKEGDSIVIKGESKEERFTPGKVEPFIAVRGRKGKKVARTFGELISISIG